MIDPFEELQQIRKQQEQLTQLVNQALKQPPRFTISDQAIAEQLAQMLPAKLEQTAQTIDTAVSRIPKHISFESEILGFASLKSLLVFTGVFFVMLAAMIWYTVHTKEQMSDLELRGNTNQKFVDWVLEKRPQVIEDYNKSLQAQKPQK
jgi:hypothetical protein